MWQISEIKQRAHFYMHTSYWRNVLAALVLSIVTGSVATSLIESGIEMARGLSHMDTMMFYYGMDLGMMGISPGFFDWAVGIAFQAAIFITIAGICISLFVMNPIEVGCERFFIVNHAMPGLARSSELFHSFGNHYLHVVKTMFLRQFYTFLWTLLFIVPGIIKHYSYRLVPYIAAEEPGMPTSEVFRLSKAMMRGNKWHAFVLDLSYIGWHILNVLTLGILGIFYVKPYQATANAELYITLRDQFLHRQS